MISTGDSLFEGNEFPAQSSMEGLTQPEGELYLKFSLPSGYKYAFSAEGIREVIQQPLAQITCIPNASPLLLGTINLRGQVIWIGDLGRFLGDKQTLYTDRSEISLLAIEDSGYLLGLAVEQVFGVQWVATDLLPVQPEEKNEFNSILRPFLKGVWLEKEEVNSPWYVLDYIAILRSERWIS